MGDNAEKRIARLEEELATVRRHLRSLFNIIDTSTDKEPFMRLMISVDATDEQEAAIYNLMNELDADLARGLEAMDSNTFCERVYQVFPDHRHHHLAESIVMRLAKEGGWDRVYEHLRQAGMSLRAILLSADLWAASSVVEHLTFNQGVPRSIRGRPTTLH